MSENKEPVEYPEIGRDYKHYKGGKYNVISMAKHSEVDEMKLIFKELENENVSPQGKELLEKLKKMTCDDLVVYKSIHFGSTSVRPLYMFFEGVIKNAGYGDNKRFKLIENK